MAEWHGADGKTNNSGSGSNSISATVLFEYLEYLKLKGPWDRRLTLIEFVNSFSINEPFLGADCCWWRWRCVRFFASASASALVLPVKSTALCV